MAQTLRAEIKRITKDNLRVAIARNIKSARMNAEPKMTQQGVAELFDPPLSRAAITQWEVGETLPDVDRIAVLSKAFGCTIDSLIFGDEPKKGDRDLTPEGVAVARLWQRLPSKERALIAALIRSSVDTRKPGR